MVPGQAFPKRGGFLNEVGVIAALRSCQGGFKGTTISDAKGPAESGDQLSVNSDHLSHRGVGGSLRQAVKEFRMLADELLNCREKR